MYLWSCILFRRSLCNVAFATCTYRLQPHRAARTSIPLRSIRSARFLTRLADASPSVQCVGRGFRHMCKKEERYSGMQAFLSPFLIFTGKIFSALFLCFHSQRTLRFRAPRCSLLHAKKPPSPRLAMSAKTAISKCAIRGSNPGHPD